jgi:quinoprotein glucose dehydrogenase
MESHMTTVTADQPSASTQFQQTKTTSRSSLVVTVTGGIYALVGLALAGGGGWLAALGGSLYYLIAGLGILITGALLIARLRAALWVYAAVLIGTLAWAVNEIGFDWWPLAARGDVVFPLGLWLLTPWIARNLNDSDGARRISTRSATLPLWAGIAASVAVLAIGLVTTYHEIDGTMATAAPAPGPVKLSSDEAQPDGDWRAYGRTQFSQRYSPLRQITPDNARNLQVAWMFRTGDLPGPNDPIETTFEVTPIKVGDTPYLCSQHQRLFALDAKTGKLRWSFDPQLHDNPTFQHLTCRGVSYHETVSRSDGMPSPRDCPRRVSCR